MRRAPNSSLDLQVSPERIAALTSPNSLLLMYTTLIDAATLYEHVNTLDWVIFDCRFTLGNTEAGRRSYQQAHIPNAHYLHLDEDLSGPIIPGVTGRHPLPAPETFAKLLGNKGVSNASQVVAYDDRGGAIASRLWWILKWLDHEAVAILDGGLQTWQALRFPLSSISPTASPKTFIPNIQTQSVASVEEVIAQTQRATPNLVDARAAQRYHGHEEPIDPIAGHIPHASSLPFAANLTESGTFADKAALLERFTTLFEEGPEPIVYCGSGVTACHNILAMTHAGLPQPRLYPGSWSHWITDTTRPVARD